VPPEPSDDELEDDEPDDELDDDDPEDDELDDEPEDDDDTVLDSSSLSSSAIGHCASACRMRCASSQRPSA
jgi:hypothetical protein